MCRNCQVASVQPWSRQVVRSAWTVVRRRRGGTTWTGRGERRESALRAGSRVSRCWMAGALCAGTWRREAHDEPAPPDERGGVTAGHRPGPRSSETAQKELEAIAWFAVKSPGVARTFGYTPPEAPGRRHKREWRDGTRCWVTKLDRRGCPKWPLASSRVGDNAWDGALSAPGRSCRCEEMASAPRRSRRRCGRGC